MPLLVVSADVENLGGGLAYDPPCFIMDALNVLLYACWLDVGIIGHKFAEFRLELWRLMEVPRDGGVKEGLHFAVSRVLCFSVHKAQWEFVVLLDIIRYLVTGCQLKVISTFLSIRMRPKWQRRLQNSGDGLCLYTCVSTIPGWRYHTYLTQR